MSHAWNLEGFRVTGLYLGDIPVSGLVYLSRVKFGGAVSHYIVLDQPVDVYGAMRERVQLEPSELTDIIAVAA